MGDADEIKSNMLKAIADNAAWQAIGAVKNNRLYFLPQDLFLLSPGLKYPEAVKTMALFQLGVRSEELGVKNLLPVP